MGCDKRTYSTSSSAWTLAMPCTRAIPSLFKTKIKRQQQLLIPARAYLGRVSQVNWRRLWWAIEWCSCQHPEMPRLFSAAPKRTRQRERGQSRRDRTPPGHHGSAALGWRKPRWAMLSRRRMCGPGRRRLRVRHFVPGAVAKQVSRETENQPPTRKNSSKSSNANPQRPKKYPIE